MSGSSSSSRSSDNADIEQMLAPGMKRGEESKRKIKNRSDEAYDWVSQFTKAIDVKTMMKTQIPLVNTRAGTITDMISLVDMPTSAFVQFKECGSIVSKEYLRNISEKIDFEASPKLWGFRSPMGVGDLDGCIYGELCNYNHASDTTDPESSFPQAPGYLQCKILNTSALAKQNDKEPTTRWIELTYSKDKKGNNVYKNRDNTFARSYLPLTEEGVMVFMWVKQCFATRNYFGMTQNGRVKYGRVHKKTRISGSGVDHSYPDATMAGRHGGDMHKFGVTPYVCQDMVKTWCTKPWYTFYKKYKYVPEEAFPVKISDYRHIDDTEIWESILETPIWKGLSDKFYNVDGIATTGGGSPSTVWDGSKMDIPITKQVLKLAIENWCAFKDICRYGQAASSWKKERLISSARALNITQQCVASASLCVWLHTSKNTRSVHTWVRGGVDPSLQGFQLALDSKLKAIPKRWKPYYVERVPVVLRPSFTDLTLNPKLKNWRLDPTEMQRFQQKIMLDHSARIFRGFSVLHETYRKVLLARSKTLGEAIRLYPKATLMNVGQHSSALTHAVISGGKGYLDLSSVKSRLAGTVFAKSTRPFFHNAVNVTIPNPGGAYVKALNSVIYYAPRMIPQGKIPFDHYIYRGANAKSIEDIKFSSTDSFIQNIPSSWSLQALPTPFQFMTQIAASPGKSPCCLFRLKVTKDVPFLMITKGKLDLIMRGLLNGPAADLPSKNHQFECIMGACILRVKQKDKIFEGLTSDDIMRFAPTMSRSWADWIERKNGFECYTLEFVAPIRHEYARNLKTDHLLCSKGVPETLVKAAWKEGKTHMVGALKRVPTKKVKARSAFGSKLKKVPTKKAKAKSAFGKKR